MNNYCVNCNGLCCKTELSCSAVMTKEEVEALKKYIAENPTLKSEVPEDFCFYDNKINAYKVRKFTNNKCVFLNPETIACRAYACRPLDCRIFPLEYRWFRWIPSPQCKAAKEFSKCSLKNQLKDFTPRQVRELKLLHIRTPESTMDTLWIFVTKFLPIAWAYKLYCDIRNKF